MTTAWIWLVLERGRTEPRICIKIRAELCRREPDCCTLSDDEGGEEGGHADVKPHPLAGARTTRLLACRRLQSYVK